MSKKSMVIAAVVAVALVGAGIGVYFYLDQTVGIKIKDQFEVGDKHIHVVEVEYEIKITKISQDGEDTIFTVKYFDSGFEEDKTYAQLESMIYSTILFDGPGIGYEVRGEERISTAFGNRDCIVYVRNDGNDQKRIIYVGKNNDVKYKSEELLDGVAIYTTTQGRSSLFIESSDSIALKGAGDIKVGDSVTQMSVMKIIFTIEGINPSTGDEPVTYDLLVNGELESSLTRDEIIETVFPVLPDEIKDSLELVGTERIDTFLGKVECDAYAFTDESTGMTAKYYLCDDIFVTARSDISKMYWERSDLIIKI